MIKKASKLIIATLFIFSLLFTIRSIYRITSGTAPDFTVFWYTTKDLVAGKNPYLNEKIFTGLGYPANTLLFYLPFLPFSYKQAQAIFILISVGVIVVTVFLSLKLSIEKIDRYALLLALSLTFLSFPTKFTLGMGQNNAIALFLVLLSLFFYQKKKVYLSGILLGVSVGLKTIFGFFFLFYVLKREWKLLLWAITPILVSIMLVAVINDINLYQYWVTKVIPPLLNLEGREIYYNQGLMGFISRITVNIALLKSASLLLSIALVVLAVKRTLEKANEKLQFSLFIIVLLLIDSMSWQHHFVWLIFPFVLLTTLAIKKKRVTTLMLIGASYVLVSWNFKNPVNFLGFPKSLILSNTFYGALILLIVNLTLFAPRKLKKKFVR
jgi:hypothetical protein